MRLSTRITAQSKIRQVGGVEAASEKPFSRPPLTCSQSSETCLSSSIMPGTPTAGTIANSMPSRFDRLSACRSAARLLPSGRIPQIDPRLLSQLGKRQAKVDIHGQATIGDLVKYAAGIIDVAELAEAPGQFLESRRIAQRIAHGYETATTTLVHQYRIVRGVEQKALVPQQRKVGIAAGELATMARAGLTRRYRRTARGRG